MEQDNTSSNSIRFPVLCHYKVITESREGIREMIEQVFREVNIEARFTEGTRSAKGKYTTYNADILIHSLELMRHIDKAIHAIQGVKVVL